MRLEAFQKYGVPILLPWVESTVCGVYSLPGVQEVFAINCRKGEKLLLTKETVEEMLSVLTPGSDEAALCQFWLDHYRLNDETKLEGLKLYAWVGEDEGGSGKIGIKKVIVDGQYMALAQMQLSKLLRFKPVMEVQSAQFGKTIYLCDFEMREVLDHTFTA